MKTRYKVGVAILAVAGACLFYLQSRSTPPDTYIATGPVGGVSETAPPPELPAAPVTFRDTSALRAPAGVKVAIMEFDDLECPACAHTLPVLRSASQQSGVPLLHFDYPLTEIHTWSFDAAVTARYLQDKVSTQAGDDFRRDVFAHQSEITNNDDLGQFTKQWFATNKLAMPFDMDSGGAESAAVKADRALGDRIGVHQTPSIFIVTPTGFAYVDDPANVAQVIASAKAHEGSA